MNADALPTPRCDGDREALRILLVAREEMTTDKTAKTNRLIALLRGGDDADRHLVRGPLTAATVGPIARRRGTARTPGPTTVRRVDARRLAIAITDAHPGPAPNKKTSPPSSSDWRRGCASSVGIGPVSAAQAIVSWSHPGRCRNEAAYAPSPAPPPSPPPAAAPAGTGSTAAATANSTAPCTPSPSPGSRRDRTRAYFTRRRAEGRSDREIRRCLKRYIARELYRALTATATTKTP